MRLIACQSVTLAAQEVKLWSRKLCLMRLLPRTKSSEGSVAFRDFDVWVGVVSILPEVCIFIVSSP
jgi:hypothetical protein